MIQSLKTKVKINKAYKDADIPCWFIEYETKDKIDQVNVFANSVKQAKRNADQIIRNANGNKPYVIKNISCI